MLESAKDTKETSHGGDRDRHIRGKSLVRVDNRHIGKLDRGSKDKHLWTGPDKRYGTYSKEVHNRKK